MKSLKININSLFLALLGFFATWGEGMQRILPKANLVYPALMAVYMLLNGNSFLKRISIKKPIVPKEFKYLFLFVLFHTLIYIFFNISSISFNTVSEVRVNDDGLIYTEESNGISILKFFVFLIFCIYLTVALYEKRNLIIFAISYIIGFVGTIFFGAYDVYGGITRVTGGVGDPNYMALDALVALMFSLYIYYKYNYRTAKIFLVISIIIELFGIIVSFSRASYLALIVVALLYLFRNGIVKNLLKLFIGCVVLGAVFSYAIKSLGEDTEILISRFSIEEMEESRGAKRGFIWEAYLSNMDTYFITGTGMRNTQVAIRNNNQGVADSYMTHNTYLQYFVEYGIVGLFLFLLYWKHFIQSTRNGSDSFFLYSIGIVLMIVIFFLNCDKGRTYWIVLTIVNVVSMNSKSSNKISYLPQHNIKKI